MMILRRAHEEDAQAIQQLAAHSGFGITTLPQNSDLLKKRLILSTQSFKKQVDTPTNEYYLFVLEDSATQQVVGTSAIEAITGYETPFYSYKVSKRTRISHALHIRNDYEVLILGNDNQGHSEICTLFLDPAYRKGSNGKLLSRARFLFMAQYPHRFAPTVIADMRGVSDETGHSPFWDHVSCHFFPISYAEADRLTLLTDKQFIADLMPRQAIYVKLLAPSAQVVIGKPHVSALPAMKLLFKEGFRYNNYVDIFDAGPTLECPRDLIKTLVSSQTILLKNTADHVQGTSYLLANTNLDFRATIAPLLFDASQNACLLSKETADALQLRPGDTVRFAPLEN